MSEGMAEFRSVMWSCRMQAVAEVVAMRGGGIGQDILDEYEARGGDDEEWLQRRMCRAFAALVDGGKVRVREMRLLGAWEAFCMKNACDLNRLNAMRFARNPSELVRLGPVLQGDLEIEEGPVLSYGEMQRVWDENVAVAWAVAQKLQGAG